MTAQTPVKHDFKLSEESTVKASNPEPPTKESPAVKLINLVPLPDKAPPEVPTKEPVKEPPPPAVKEPVKEPPPPAVKEPVKEPPPPAVKEPVKEPPPPAVKEPVKEPPPPAVKEPVKEPPPPAVKEPVKEPPPPAVKEVPPLAIREGCLVLAPYADFPRLPEMRSKFLSPMMLACGEICEVVRVRGRQVQLRLHRPEISGTIEQRIMAEDNNAFWWDIDMMPACNQRYCGREGCELDDWTGPAKCDICATLYPKGSKALRCQEHNYDVCEFCECLHACMAACEFDDVHCHNA
jgi:hypothetical protein